MNASLRTTILAASAILCVRCADAEELFRNATFEELANVVVTTVTRAPQEQFAAPAAVYAITAAEARASGALNIPDALRLAPGVHVAQFDAHSWAIAVRGFSSLFSDKLLLLVDGRSVYTPLWSGVYWEQQEWLDQDLDRIEVINGPGGSVWGANAVNGVINVVNKPARDTQGLAIEAGSGSEDRAFGALRYGDALGAHGFYRVYAGYRERDATERADGRDVDDAWHKVRGGVRYERDTEDAHFMLKGEAYSASLDQPAPVPTPTAPYSRAADAGESSGGSVQTVWSRRSSDGRELRIDSWWTHYARDLLPSHERSNAFNFDAHYRLALGPHSLALRGGFRRVEHELLPNFVSNVRPPRSRDLDWWSASAHDEIALTSRLALSAGLLAEHNEFTGWEWQPNARLSWRSSENQIVWTSIGRAVRTPSIANDAAVHTPSVLPPGSLGPGTPVVLQQSLGDSDLASEILIAYEAGWRARWGNVFSAAVNAFYNDYDDLILYEIQPLDTTTLAPEFWRIPVQAMNSGSGNGYGAEVTMMWQPVPAWRLSTGIAFLHLNVEPAQNVVARQYSGASPERQATLHVEYDPGGWWWATTTLRYVDDLASLRVADYVAADARIAFRLGRDTEFAIVGRNLLEERHAEFRSASFIVDSYVERSVCATIAWRL